MPPIRTGQPRHADGRYLCTRCGERPIPWLMPASAYCLDCQLETAANAAHGRAASDLTGNVYGRWSVLGRVTPIVRPGPRWWCLCDRDRGGCGRVAVVLGERMTRGGSVGCRSCHLAALAAARRKS